MKIMINGETVDATPEQEAAMIALTASDSRNAERFNTELQQKIDAKAQEKQYAGGVACASYFNSTNEQWSAEARAFIAWRDMCFEYGYDYLAQVQAGNIPDPNIDEFLLGLPELEWPTINPQE